MYTQMNANIRKTSFLLLSLMAPLSAIAEENNDVSIDELTPSPAAYEAGRGLITLEGPSGMFMNPTSATLGARASTIQYCMFLPNGSTTDTVGNGFMGAYGVTDSVEIGVIAKYISPNKGSNLSGVGPFARLRLTKNEGLMPQLSVGGYAQFGDDPLTTSGIFSAAYWRIPINEDGFLKSLGVHAGIRETWYDVGASDAFYGYAGLEVQLPLRVYLIGEVSTQDSDRDLENAPYAYGLQWRLYGVNISLAGIQNGSLPNGPELYWGIGGGFQF